MEKLIIKLMLVLLVMPGLAQALSIDFEGASAGDFVTNQFAGVDIESLDSAHAAMIFDSANPTGDDQDLFTESEGNILIISEDNNQSNPDDNADGGILTFIFDNPVNFSSISFVDIEEHGGNIATYKADGSLSENLSIPGLTNNSLQEIFSASDDAISSLEVELSGSGGIARLEGEPVPEPSTFALLLMGIIAFFYRSSSRVV